MAKKNKVVELPKLKAIKEKFTKKSLNDHILSELEEEYGFDHMDKEDVQAVMTILSDTIQRSICTRGIGTFTFPGLFKIKTVKKPAKKARKNVPNPFKPGEMMDTKAKPASIKTKILPLKALKEAAER